MYQYAIFGFDIDGCLSQEYCLVQHQSHHIIHYQGDAYNHAKNNIREALKQNPNIEIIFTSFSSRQSLRIDTYSSYYNCVLFSPLLLHALAQQIALELKCTIWLDTGWLEDLQQDHYGSFNKRLEQPEEFLYTISDNGMDTLLKRCKELEILTVAEYDSYLRNEKSQKYFKLVRVRHMLAVISNIFKISPWQKIQLYLYDDIKEYLTVFDELFALKTLDVDITTFWVNAFVVYKNKHYMLDRNKITPLNKFNSSKNCNLKENFTPWLVPYVKSFYGMINEITHTSEKTLLSRKFIYDFNKLAASNPGGKNKYFRTLPTNKTRLQQNIEKGKQWGKPPFPRYED